MERSATYDFLLVIYSTHKSVLYCFRDKRRLWSKIAKFPFPTVCISHWGFPLEMCNDGVAHKTTMMPQVQCWKVQQYAHPFTHDTVVLRTDGRNS